MSQPLLLLQKKRSNLLSQQAKKPVRATGFFSGGALDADCSAA
jgi:hypothetical protein